MYSFGCAVILPCFIDNDICICLFDDSLIVILDPIIDVPIIIVFKFVISGEYLIKDSRKLNICWFFDGWENPLYSSTRI